MQSVPAWQEVLNHLSTDPIDAGQNTRLRIDLFAPADTNLTNFSVTDNLPAGVTISNVNSAYQHAP